MYSTNGISQFLTGFSGFVRSAKPAVGSGRNIGGTVVYIRNSYEKFITRLCPDFAHGILFYYIDRRVFFVRVSKLILLLRVIICHWYYH